MTQIKLFLVLLLFVCTAFHAAQAQSVPNNNCCVDTLTTSVQESFVIDYRFDSININQSYRNNEYTLNRIKEYLENSPHVDSITIYSWASPEGTLKHNKWLSRERGKSAKEYLLSISPDSSKLNSGMIKISPEAENWQGLYEMVVLRYKRHDREKVLKILTDNSVGNETRKWRLQQLDKGYTWSFLKRIYMPELRSATWICVWTKPTESPMLIAELGMPTQLEKVAQQVVPQQKNQDSEIYRTALALKTNLLYDAATLLNYSIEVPFNKNFSVLFQQHSPWWETKNNKWCVEMLTLGAEFRWWFAPRTVEESEFRKKRDALVGHFIGVHGWSGKGDFQLGRKLCYQYEFWSAGITYGYSMPVGKYFNMEFAISAGYANIPYQHYIPTKDFDYLIKDNNKVGTMKYFGLTKAEISLVLPIRVKTKR